MVIKITPQQAKRVNALLRKLLAAMGLPSSEI